MDPAPRGGDGVLLLDKPPGITSTQALGRARRLLNADKAGHTGTLDPFATGLLPLVFGEATKFGRFLLDARKAYRATLRLGQETVTGDTEAPVIRSTPVSCNSTQIDEVIASFRGVQQQVPPMHSAVRINGRRLYDLARAGQEVERASRTVDIQELEVLGRAGDDLTVFVACSKGTYIRTLAMDVGRALGCGAHLVALRRVEVGGFSLENAINFEEMEPISIEERRSRLLPVEVLVNALRPVEVTADQARRLVQGQELDDIASEPREEVAVFAPGRRFVGVGWREGPGARFAPLRLMSVPDPKAPDFA